MFESSQPSLLLDHFRVPYRVVSPDQGPESGLVRLHATRTGRSLWWPGNAADGLLAPARYAFDDGFSVVASLLPDSAAQTVLDGSGWTAEAGVFLPERRSRGIRSTALQRRYLPPVLARRGHPCLLERELPQRRHAGRCSTPCAHACASQLLRHAPDPAAQRADPAATGLQQDSGPHAVSAMADRGRSSASLRCRIRHAARDR